MGVTIKEKPVTPDGTHFREFVNYDAWEAYLRRMAMDSEWCDWIALWGLVKTVTMNICVIDEDCVIGRWYKLDFELMSLCPHFFFLFITCMSNFFTVLSLFSSSFRFHEICVIKHDCPQFFCLFEMRQISEHIRL